MSTADELRAKAAKLLDLARDYETPIQREDLDHMTPDQIIEARTDGRLDHLLNPTQEK